MTLPQPGVCFVINDYNWQTDTHYRHLYRLIEEIARHRPVCVLVEVPFNSQERHALDDLILVQRQQRCPLRAVEELFLLLRLRKKGFATFYIHYSRYGGTLASLVTRLFGGKTFYWHCEEMMKYRKPVSLSVGSVRQWVWMDAATGLAMHLAHCVLTGNQAMVEHYRRAYGLEPSKLKVFPNYIDLAEFVSPAGEKARMREKLGLDPKHKVILYVHRLVERKGAHYIAEIVQRVIFANGHIPIRFLVVGDGPYRPTLERELVAGGLNGYVRLIGAVPNAEIAAVYAVADLFIMPSDVEGFPRVLLEAMASGVPFVASEVGGVRELLRGPQLDYVIIPGDVQQFANKVTSLLNDPDTCQVLASVGYDSVSHYSLERACERFLHIMDEV